jgi:DNA polymerase-3 subunit epsilon
VVDVETTGLDAASERILEVAVVRLDADARVTGEYATKVSIDGPVLLSEVHGLTAAQLSDAPPFAAVGAALAARLTGTVVVGHNVTFDLAFLRAEYRRAGVAMPVFPALCTRELAVRLGREPEAWNLRACCAEAGVVPDLAHTALGDARSTAALFKVYLAAARAGIGDTMEALGAEPPLPPPRHWRTGIAFSGRQNRRPGAELLALPAIAPETVQPDVVQPGT